MQNRYRDEYGRFAKRSNTDSEPLFVNLFDSSSSSSSLNTYSHTSNTINEDELLIKFLHDYLHPTCNSAPSCIMFPANVQNIDFREFKEVVATFHNQLGAMDILN